MENTSAIQAELKEDETDIVPAPAVSASIDKLVNHCIKATTRRQRLVYNFKGYDKFCPDSRTKTIQFNIVFLKIF